MHMRAWCNTITQLFLFTDQAAYPRCARAADTLFERGPRGHGRDLTPREVVRVMVVGFLPSRQGEWLVQAQKLLKGRAYAPSPHGGLIATGEDGTFEDAMVALLTDPAQLDNVTEVALTGVVPWAEITRSDGSATVFVPVKEYKKGRTLVFGASAVQATLFSREALRTIAEKLQAERAK
jgi:hypothetical protein